MAKIVLTGSLGNIGKPLAIALIESGHAVTIISSNASRQGIIEALGAKAAIGSIKDSDFLTATFVAADIVYLMEPPIAPDQLSNPNFTFTDMLNNINDIVTKYKEAILQAGVKRVIHLSSIGAHTDSRNGLLKHHYYAEKILNELPSDVYIKFIRPVGLFPNILPMAQVIKQLSRGVIGIFMALHYYGLGGLMGGKRGVILSNLAGNDINLLVSPLDIAAVIAEEIGKPFSGRTFRYVASEEMTCNEVAKALGDEIGKPYLKWGQISDKRLLNAMKRIKWSPSIAQAFVEMQAAGRGGENSYLYQDYYKHRPVLGKTKLKDYVKEFAKEYHKQ